MKDDPMLRNDTPQSSMRWSFVWTTRVVLVLVSVTVIGSVIASLMGKTVDIIGISALLSPIVLFSFGGKAVQSKFENENKTPKSE